MKPLFFALVLTTLSACGAQPDNLAIPEETFRRHHIDHGTHLEIVRDPGGSLYQRIAHYHSLSISNKPVHITGRCASACTLYLGLDDVCVSPTARLGFHGPYHSKDYLVSEQRKGDIRLMTAIYPEKLNPWFLRDAAHLVGREMLWIEGQALTDFDIPLCNTPASVQEDSG